MIERRYWIALALGGLAAAAVVLGVTSSFWLVLAAFPFAFGAVLCIAPRAWLSNAGYGRAINVLAYASMIPAAIALAGVIGFVTVAVVALPVLATFVIVTRMSMPRATRSQLN